MTKDEFLKMVDTLIDKLNKEFEINNINVEYFRRVAPNGEEFKKAQYQQDFVRSKINALRDLVKLPAYARVQAMSDKELEKYRKDKIKELELKVKEIELKEDQARNELADLKRKQDQLISEFGSASDDKKEKIINEGQPLIYRIREYEKEDGILAHYKKEKDELKNKQDKIKKLTLEEIKQHLSNEIQGSSDLKEEIKKAQVPFDEYSELLASVASDAEKAQKMANMLADYRNTFYRQEHIKGTMNLPPQLPNYLKKDLIKDEIYYNEKTKDVINPDKLMEIVNNYEKAFKEEKEKFYKQFTEQKLSELVDKYNKVKSFPRPVNDAAVTTNADYQDYLENCVWQVGTIKTPDVDMIFLQQHADKIYDYEKRLKKLQNLIRERAEYLNKFSNDFFNKIFKRQPDQGMIDYYNVLIGDVLKKIYIIIIIWYKEFDKKELLGLNHDIDFSDQETLRESLEKCRDDVKKSEEAISELKETIQRVKEDMEKEKQMYETQKTKIEQKIRDLVGEKYSKTEIKSALMSDRGKIINTYGRIYKTDIIRQVLQEAQNQADLKEAELEEETTYKQTSQGKKH